MKFRRKRSAKDGISMIEMVVSIGLTGIILVPASALMLQSFGNQSAYQQQNSTQQSARFVADLVADDMKGAIAQTSTVFVGGLQTTLPTNTVQGVSPNGTNANVTYSAPVYFNIYNDAGTARRVRYWLEGTNLRREIVDYVDDTTTPGAAASATAGVVMAQNVQVFRAERQPILVSGALPNYDVVRITVQTGQTSTPCSQLSADTVNTSCTMVTVDATLRNNLISGSS